jgi:hypothetical protein
MIAYCFYRCGFHLWILFDSSFAKASKRQQNALLYGTFALNASTFAAFSYALVMQQNVAENWKKALAFGCLLGLPSPLCVVECSIYASDHEDEESCLRYFKPWIEIDEKIVEEEHQWTPIQFTPVNVHEPISVAQKS